MAYCSECGGLNAEALRFCIHCGKEIAAQKKSSVVSQPSAQTMPTAPTQVTSKSPKATQGKNKTTPLVIVLCLLVLILAGVVYSMSQNKSTEKSDSASTIEETTSSTAEDVDQISVVIPSDAEPLEITSWDSIDNSPQYPMSEFSCDVLAISFEFDECMSSSTFEEALQ